jgi:SAM-dependent methyltransferase
MTSDNTRRRVLNAGSGFSAPDRLHVGFDRGHWAEVRLDVDPRTTPDLVGSISDMRDVIPDETFDAVWTSHSVEHLYTHEVVPAFCEFRRILKPDGFVLATCPNLEPVMELVLRCGLDTVAYQSPAGPIKAIDMLYGHGRSIASGQWAMAHHTGFTPDRIGEVALQAGFCEARVLEGDSYDLWAVLLMPNSDLLAFASSFATTKIGALFG